MNDSRPDNVPGLQRLIDEAKQSFPDPAKAGDAVALGKLVATWADWDGHLILGVILSALTDANLHGLREEIRQLVLEKGLARPTDTVELS